MGKLVLPLLALPVLDLFLVLRLRHEIGGWPTLLALLLSAAAGTLIARTAGARALREWRSAFAEGAAPNRGVLDGALLLFGCLWLIVPGPISDVLGVLLLINPTRRWLAQRLGERLRSALQRGTWQVVMPRAYPQTADLRGPPDVIDVEGETVEAPAAARDARSRQLEP